MKINEKIKSRRQELGLTLEEVGNYVGVSKATMINIHARVKHLIEKYNTGHWFATR